jgi:hypothetical protein
MDFGQLRAVNQARETAMMTKKFITLAGVAGLLAFTASLATTPIAQAAKEPATAKAQMSSTIGQRNAKRSAESYLRLSAFSKSGLIEQLEYEGFSRSDARWAVNHIRVSWRRQAAKSAKSYLRLSSFSRSGLIEQLEYEGFTHWQAVYGVRAGGY